MEKNRHAYNNKRNTKMKRRARTYWACKYFKSCGNVFGGCKHPKAANACSYQYIDECQISERRTRNSIVQQQLYAESDSTLTNGNVI